MVSIADERMASTLTLRSRVMLKRELQRLVRAHAASCAFLGTTSTSGEMHCRLEYAGDPGALPAARRLRGGRVFVCSQRLLPCVDGEEREVVLLYSRVCSGVPTLVLGLVDARTAFTDVLTDDVEAAAEHLESVLVDALEPAEEPSATRPAKARRH